MIDPIVAREMPSSSDSDAITNLLDTVPESGELPPVETPPAEAPLNTEPPVPEAVVRKEEKPTGADSDEDFHKQLDAFQSSTPAQAKGFPALKALATSEREKRRELEVKLKEKEEDLKKIQASTSQLTPEIQAELDELRPLRRAEAPEKDPEFQEKYLNPIKASDERALAIMKNHGLRDTVASAIEEAGGLSKVSISSDIVPTILGGDKTWAEWFEEVVLPKTPEVERHRLKNLVASSLDLMDKMKDDVGSAKTNVTERQAQKEQTNLKDFETGATELQASLGVMAQKWEYPKDATDADKQKVDAHNTRYEQSIKDFTSFRSNLKTPKDMGRIVAIASQASYLSAANQDLAKQIETKDARLSELEDRLAKIKGSGSSPAKRSNAMKPGTEPPKVNTMSSKDAVSALMEEYGN